MIVYVAGPYSGDTEQNIENAATIAAELWDKGFTVFCPHTNTAGFENRCLQAQYNDFIRGCLEMLSVCDAVVFIPGWENSKGAQMEQRFAFAWQIPTFYYPNLPANLVNRTVKNYLADNEGIRA